MRMMNDDDAAAISNQRNNQQQQWWCDECGGGREKWEKKKGKRVIFFFGASTKEQSGRGGEYLSSTLSSKKVANQPPEPEARKCQYTKIQCKNYWKCLWEELLGRESLIPEFIVSYESRARRRINFSTSSDKPIPPLSFRRQRENGSQRP